MNERIKNELAQHEKSVKKCHVLKDTDTEYEDVVILQFYEGQKYYVYRRHYGVVSDYTLSSRDYHVDESADFDQAVASFDKACKGMLKCYMCGKWIPFEEARFFMPAGITCRDEACTSRARKDEEWFLNHLD